MTALIVVEAVAIGLLGLLVAGLLRSHAEILRRLHELGAGVGTGEEAAPPRFRVAAGVPAPGGTPAPDAADIAGVTPFDEAVAVRVAGAEQHTLLAFLSSGCTTCAGFWRAFADGPALPPATRLVVVTKGPDQESESALRRLTPAGVPVVMSSAAWDDYGVPGSPYVVYVDGPSGRVAGEGAATSWPQVASLLSQAVADSGGQDRRGGGRGGRGRRQRGRPEAGLGDAAREARADRELRAAGIHPGHPSLYPEAGGDAEGAA